MPPRIAAIMFAIGIAGLFWLERDRKSRTSLAFWLPIVWLFLGSSRNLSVWLGAASSPDALQQYVDGNPVDRLLLSGLQAAGLMVLAVRRQRTAALVRANLPIVLFLLFCLASVLWSDFPYVTFKRWVKTLGNVTMILIVLTEADPAAAVKRLFAWAGFLLIPLSVLLIRYYPDLGRAYNQFTWTPSFIGVATDKNGLGVICLVFGLAALWMLIEALRDKTCSHRTARITAQGVVVAMALWLFSVANSSTSLGCFLLGSAVIVGTTWSGIRRPVTVYSLTGAMVFVAVIAFAFLDVDAWVIQALGRDTTLTGRTELWDELLHLPINSWIGTGFESFWLGDRARQLWDKYWWHPNQAHNGYLEMYLALGWIGVGFLVLLIGLGYRNIVASFGRDPASARFKLALILIIPLYNITEATFKLTNPIWVTFLLIITAVPALLTVDEKEKERSSTETTPAVPWRQRERRELSHVNSGGQNRFPVPHTPQSASGVRSLGWTRSHGLRHPEGSAR